MATLTVVCALVVFGGPAANRSPAGTVNVAAHDYHSAETNFEQSAHDYH